MEDEYFNELMIAFLDNNASKLFNNIKIFYDIK